MFTRNAWRSCVALILLTWAAGAHAASTFDSINYIPPTEFETSSKAKRVELLADRKVYWNDDGLGQFLVYFLGQDTAGKFAVISVVDADTKAPAVTMRQGPMTQPKAVLLLDVSSLKPAKYLVKATLEGVVGADGKPVEAQVEFTREDKAAAHVPFPPEGIEIFVDPPPAGDKADGSWPICAGIPFPKDTLPDDSHGPEPVEMLRPARQPEAGIRPREGVNPGAKGNSLLALFENGKQIPVQIDPIAFWSPTGNLKHSSVQWAHVNFEARYDAGVPRKYVLKRMPMPAPAVPGAPKLDVKNDPDKITVDNGVIRFTVSKKKFTGVDEAWIDLNGDGKFDSAERAIGADPAENARTTRPGGAYFIDQRGVEYQAAMDDKVEVTVEESGPFRVVIAAKGWYSNNLLSPDTGMPKLCQFVTRIVAWAGRSDIRVQHQTILTFDANDERLLDLGFRLSLPGDKQFSFGFDGQAVAGQMPKAPATAYLHQFRWNQLRLVGAKVEKNKPVEVTGSKSDGWVTAAGEAAGGGPAVTLVMRDIWQKYPKELEASESRLIAHFWPAHGKLTFSEDEKLAKSEIFKIRGMHEGKLMDLRLPSEVFSKLDQYNQEERWDWEDMRISAISGNGQGVAVGNDMLIRLHPANVVDQLHQARLFQQSPLARASGQWNADTKTLGSLTASDPARLPDLEKAVNRFYPDYMRDIVDGCAEYGMWIYADIHDNWLPDIRAPRLHRVWYAGHYQHIWTPWMLYFRGGPPEILNWARANSDHFRDLNVVHYDDPARPLKNHNTGAMYHCKGFLPWGSSAYGDKVAWQMNNDYVSYGGEHTGIQGHWINPDALLLRYKMEGDWASLDALKLWQDGIKRHRMAASVGRNMNTFLGEIIPLYEFTHDADLLGPLQGVANAMLTHKMEEMPDPYHHPVFHQNWFDRLYDSTRDPRVVASLKTYTDEGHKYGRQFPNVAAFLYRTTGDKAYVQMHVPAMFDFAHEVYDNPDDPLLNGYCGGMGGGTGQWNYRSTPYWIAAADAAGIKTLAAGAGRGIYPSHATHPSFIASEAPALELLVYKPEDKPFNITFETVPGYDHYDPLLHVYDPANRLALDRPSKPGGTRFVGENIVHIPFAPDGKTGVYRFDFRNNEDVPFLAPYSDLPVEGALLQRAPEKSHTKGRVDLFLLPLGPTPKAKLTFTALKRYDISSATYIRVDDANGKTLLETTLLYGSKRLTADLELDPKINPAPYHVYEVSGFGPAISWSGQATAILVTAKPQAAIDLAKQLK